MIKPPTGHITFLFTDIEGSTKLAQEFPDTLQHALDIHHTILHNAIESHNGFVFEIIGDAFCAAFDNTQDAVNAAIVAQVNLANEKWNDAVIKVRMGIHSGNAEWSGKRYMGYITLARTARVMSAAYGGQVLISDDAYKQLIEKENVSFRDLGERRLKDVIQPIRLFQISASGLKDDFPPLKTLDARPNNLPVQLTSFIGREEEIKNVKEFLKNARLLTLIGSGGAGKTRLSLQAGADIIDDFANGVWLVELAPISDPLLLPQTIINALGLKEEPKKTLEQTLIDYLNSKELLIILDNCEHLIAACAELTEKLLSSCTNLKIIATTREALNCSGEQIYRIPSLSHPDPNSNDTPEQLTQYESVRLFIERALSVNPKFRVNNDNAPALAEICSRLDGVPLAIELAAARIKVLSVEKIYDKLDDRFNLLTGGKRTALPRQQTLRALIDWSYDLLTENEKLLWSRLTVFKGGWTLEAAEEVCSDETINRNEILDLLSGLTEKSIIIYDESKERYRILETIKQYGREKLRDENEIFSKHLNYFKELAEKAEPELRGDNSKLCLDTLEAEHSNLQSAIEWSIDNEEGEKAAWLAVAIGKFWFTRGHYLTGSRLIENILTKPDILSKEVLAKILYRAGVLNYNQGKNEIAEKYLKDSLSLSKESGDKRLIAESLNILGNIDADHGNYEQAVKYYDESLELKRKINDKFGISVSLLNLGTLVYSQGNYEQALQYYEESMSLRLELGDKLGIAITLLNLGNLAYSQGNYEQAQKYHEESIGFSREIGDKSGIAKTLHSLGNVFYSRGNFEQSKRYYEDSLILKHEIGDKSGIAESLLNLGVVTQHIGNYEQAKLYYNESLKLSKEIGDKRGIANSLINLGGLACECGNYKQAQLFIEESLALSNEIGDKLGIADTFNSLGIVSHKQEEYENAVRFLSFSEKALESMSAVITKAEQKEKDELISKLHEKLSDEEFNKYWDEGSKMTLDEAVELALKKE